MCFMNKKIIILSDYLRQKFGQRVQRLPIDPGFNCPNRQNNKSGCIYCSDGGSGALWLKPQMTLEDQILKGIKIAKNRYKAKKYIAYFQAFTSTNCMASELDALFSKVLNFEGVDGLAISTRPDCIDSEKIEVFKKYKNKVSEFWIELGAQSMHDSSLLWMNRGHDSKCFADMVKTLNSEGIKTVGHIIFGLPCENKEQMLESFKKFIDTGVWGVKIHALHIIKDTKLAQMHAEQPFTLLTLNEYVDVVSTALNQVQQEIIVHRLTGETPAEVLIAPYWVINKNDVRRMILERIN